jgi:hypothetical protein
MVLLSLHLLFSNTHKKTRVLNSQPSRTTGQAFDDIAKACILFTVWVQGDKVQVHAHPLSGTGNFILMPHLIRCLSDRLLLLELA